MEARTPTPEDGIPRCITCRYEMPMNPRLFCGETGCQEESIIIPQKLWKDRKYGQCDLCHKKEKAGDGWKYVKAMGLTKNREWIEFYVVFCNECKKEIDQPHLKLYFNDLENIIFLE